MTGESQIGPRHRIVRSARGFELSICRSGIRFQRFSYARHDMLDGADEIASAHDPTRRRIGWLLPAILLSGSAAAGVLAAPAGPVPAPYSISMWIPAPARPAVRAPARSHPRMDRPRSMARTVPIADDRAERSEERFTEVAMTTGEMQSWQTDGARLFLVPGELLPADGRPCRQFSLLTRRDDGGDTVRQFERCRPSD